jgi:UMF1 family MFS transporter
LIATLSADSTSFSKKVVAAWASFDFAMSSFSGIMVTFVFPIYFINTIVTDGHGDKYWGFTLSASMLSVALLTPLLGAMADVLHNKKAFLGIFTSITIACTVLLYFMQPGMALVAAALFILANIGYEGGTVFYDAFIPEITTPQTFGRVSGFGYALGYLGSLVILIVNWPFFETAPKFTFVVTAAFYAVFALPMFLVVPERRRNANLSFGELTKRGFGQLATTVRHIREYKDITRFLTAFFIYNDAILTVILFAGIFARKTLHFSMTDLAIWFAMIQIVAVMGSLVFGKFADRHGPKRVIGITLLIWVGVVTAAYFTTTDPQALNLLHGPALEQLLLREKIEFYFVGGVAGIALGSSQACSRSFMALLTPPEHTAEFFGFYDGFCGKASAVIGPVVFGVLSDLFGSQRPAIWAMATFFVIGLILLRRVNERRAEQDEERLEVAAG